MKAQMNHEKVKEIMGVSILITLIFVIIMTKTGSIYSGYHLVDDHWVIRTKLNLEGNTAVSLIRSYIASDLSIRFRPFYQVLLVLKTIVLGVDMNHWMFVSMIEGILANIFLYFYGRNLGLGRVGAFTAAGIMLYGTQFMPWYRSLNAENTPAMLLAFVFLLLSAGFRKEVKLDEKWWYRGMIMALLISSSLMKEAFCITIPAMVMYIFFLYSQKYGETFLISIFKKNIDYCIILGAVFLLEIYIIVSKVGLLPIGYAGIDTSMGFWEYLQSIVKSFQNEMKLFAVLSILSFAVFILKIIKQVRTDSLTEFLKKNIWFLLFGIYGIMSQLVLHARSGMWGRYILPFSLIWGSAVLIPFMRILQNAEIMQRKWMHFAAAVSCIGVLVTGLHSAWLGAENWAGFGAACNALLNESRNRIVNESEGNILLHINDGEFDIAAQMWLTYFVPECRDRVFLYMDRPKDQDFRVIITSRDFYENDADFFDIVGKGKEEYQSAEVWGSYLVLYINTQ